MTTATLVLAAVTFALKGAGVLVPKLPAFLDRRLGGLAPALLAALVITEVTGNDGVPTFDAKAAGVAVAVILATVRAPLLVSVIGGAATAALVRAFT